MLSRILAPEEYDSADTQEDNMSEDMSGVRNKRGATVGKVKQPEVVGMSAEVGRSIRDTGIGMRTSGANRQKAALFLSKLLTSVSTAFPRNKSRTFRGKAPPKWDAWKFWC